MMMKKDRFADPLPARSELERALGSVSRRLTAELQSPSEEPPDWQDFEWRVAMAVAVMQGTSALLARRLRWRGPGDWQSFLAEQREHGVLRERRIRQLLERIDLAAREAGVPLVALKGSALLHTGIYAAGERPQSDIDLLCREQDLGAADRAIAALGYEAKGATWKHRVYDVADGHAEVRFGEHEANPLKIELHTRIAERLPYSDVQVDVFPAEAQPGLNGYARPSALLNHLLLHVAGNLSWRGGRLIQVHDIARLCRQLPQTELADVAGDPRARWWKWPSLRIAERCFPGSVPDFLLARTAEACPWHLRHWVDSRSFDELSLVDPRHATLLGLAWATDLREAVRYLGESLVPPESRLEGQTMLIRKDPWSTGSDWQWLPRWQRVLHRLFRRPVRAPTLYSLHSAIAYHPANS
ncbi:nucleotidyltransferase family protein [Roseateles agri]|nr:nucleotidyltransferase family protein [Paucibacter sp. R3-3]